MSNYDNPNDPNRLTPSGPEVRRSDVGRDDLTYNRRTTSSFWPWIVGLIVLLAIGWIVIEAFDQDTGPLDDGAVPAAGEVDGTDTSPGTGINGTGRMNDNRVNEEVTPRPAE